MAKIVLTGYCDRFSVKPGEEISFMVSAEGTETADVQLVRLIHGDENPEGPGFIEKEVAGPIDGGHAVHKQHTQAGSFARIDDPDNRLALDHAFTLWALIWPTTPEKGRQGILSRWSITTDRGYALGINSGGELEFWVGDGKKTDAVHGEVPLRARQWYLVAASYDPKSGQATLYQERIENRYGNLLSKIVPLDMSSHATETLRIKPADAELGFLMAGSHDHNAQRGDFVGHLYNGKLDRCGVVGRVMSRADLDAMLHTISQPEDAIAHWDTSAGYTENGIGDDIADIGPHKLHGRGCNRPVRGGHGI